MARTTATDTLRTPTLDRLVDGGELLGYSVAVRRGDGRTLTAVRGGTGAAPGRPVTEATSYRLASLSKPVAGLLAAVLRGEGLLAPDDEVRRWVPELDGVRVLRTPDADLDDTEPLTRPMTVHDLLTMTSGLGIGPTRTPLSLAMARAGVHPGPLPPTIDDTTFLARLAELPLAFQPGAGWAYHTSTDVLSVLLARASGRPLDRLVADRVTGPLDASSLSFRAPGPETAAPAHRREAGGWVPLEAEGTAPPAMLTLSSGLWGTAADTARFLAELVSPTVAPAELVREVRRPGLTDLQLAAARPFVPEGYSFGHHVSVATRDDPAGPRHGSAGWSGGTGTLGIADPAAGRTVVLLTARELGGPGDTVAFDAVLADLWADVRADAH